MRVKILLRNQLKDIAATDFTLRHQRLIVTERK